MGKSRVPSGTPVDEGHGPGNDSPGSHPWIPGGHRAAGNTPHRVFRGGHDRNGPSALHGRRSLGRRGGAIVLCAGRPAPGQAFPGRRIVPGRRLLAPILRSWPVTSFRAEITVAVLLGLACRRGAAVRLLCFPALL